MQAWELYERHARLWTDTRRPDVTIESAWMEQFCALLPPSARVLDMGCGHGRPIGAHLLHRGFELWGIDRAAALIDVARADLPTGAWQVADMASFDLDQTFSGFVMWHSFFHLHASDQRRVFRLIGAHAQPDATVLFTTGDEAGSVDGEFGGEPLPHHSLSADEYTHLLAQEGFSVVDHRVADPECGNATVWLAKRSTRTHDPSDTARHD